MSLVTFIRPEQRASTALVRTSSCRVYVVELDPGLCKEPKILRNLIGRVVHFRSIDSVRDALRRRGVREATLVQNLACEEISALGVSTRAEKGLAILSSEAS